MLEVDTSREMDVAPEIIVPPANITVTRQKSVAELQCIAMYHVRQKYGSADAFEAKAKTASSPYGARHAFSATTRTIGTRSKNSDIIEGTNR